MHYKTNRQNHDFQIAYFIAGACQTPDAAYAILKDLREDRSNAINSYTAGKLREQAKIVRATALLASDDEATRLDAQADLAEIEGMVATSLANYNAALAEMAFIDKCIEKVQPLRKFSHLTDAEAFEAAQQEEWKFSLIHQAENSLLTSGTVTAELFSTMRMHPDFESEIFPAVNEIKMMLVDPEAQGKLVERIVHKGFDLPKLLGN
jgi:hypothetical protein